MPRCFNASKTCGILYAFHLWLLWPFKTMYEVLLFKKTIETKHKSVETHNLCLFHHSRLHLPVAEPHCTWKRQNLYSCWRRGSELPCICLWTSFQIYVSLTRVASLKFELTASSLSSCIMKIDVTSTLPAWIF